MIRIENNDKLQDQQRLICWVSVIAAISIGLVASAHRRQSAYGDGRFQPTANMDCSGFMGAKPLHGQREAHKKADCKRLFLF